MRTGCLIATLALLAGCTGAEPVLPTGPDVAPSARALALIADSLGTAEGALERRRRVVRAFTRYGLTPLADMGRQRSENPRFSVGGPVVAGLVPGRYALARPELVIVGAEVDGPYAAPLLEAARVLVERSEWANVPERTVMVALWSGDRGPESALRLGVWPRDRVRAVIVVGEGGRVPTDVPSVRVLPGADALDLADGLLAEILRQSRRAAPGDTPAAR